MVEVKVQSYNNPTNGCATCGIIIVIGGCCDGFTLTSCTGQLRCDNQFNYCLRSHNTPATTRGCQGYTSKISEVNTDGGCIDFLQPTVLGLPNPLTLTGLTNSWQVSILFPITTCVYMYQTVLKSCIIALVVADNQSATMTHTSLNPHVKHYI